MTCPALLIFLFIKLFVLVKVEVANCPYIFKTLNSILKYFYTHLQPNCQHLPPHTYNLTSLNAFTIKVLTAAKENDLFSVTFFCYQPGIIDDRPDHLWKNH